MRGPGALVHALAAWVRGVAQKLRAIGRSVLAATAVVLATGAHGAAAVPDGQITWGVHISLAPTWFDPAETPGVITPFMVMYALHDAMVKPMPSSPFAASLAESWKASDDGPIRRAMPLCCYNNRRNDV